MGLLSQGTPLPWAEAKKYADHVRKHGIMQFLAIYNRVKDRQRDSLLWGDEIEYVLVDFDHSSRSVRLSLRASEVLEQLQAEEHSLEAQGKPLDSSWKPEYARYMLEATPGSPYSTMIKSLLSVEGNMCLRRSAAEKLLVGGEFLMTLTNFPLLGCTSSAFLTPHHEPRGDASHSAFIPDEAISAHARFATLTRNIRHRRQKKVEINIPIFHDSNTPRPFVEKFPEPAPFPEDGYEAAKPDHIYMDCMCFGMGCSCLQITFQACNIDEARMLYDQLAMMTPIMLALTAASPIFRGYLADVDCRWDIISRSVDDRTAEELGQVPLKNSRFHINKSRYDSIDSFLSLDPQMKEKYNDLDLVFDADICKTLQESGVDELLARHMAHLFIRDPIVIYKELVDQDDSKSSDHFENIQSTNWQTMRFKPPPPNSPIGWRVEFRSMEIQMTEFENAAFAIFIVLLTRTILSFGINLYIPISKIDENMKRAQLRDAVNQQRFHFRNHVFADLSDPNGSNNSSPSLQTYGSPGVNSNFSNPLFDKEADEDAYSEMTVNEIMNGKKSRDGIVEFVGLVPLVDSYLTSMNIDIETLCKLTPYLDLVRKRASGEYMTNAAYMRRFVRSHSEYKSDSVVTSGINYDLCMKIKEIAEGKERPAEMFGKRKV